MATNDVEHRVSSVQFRIIWEDDALLVVDKPAGLPVLPDGWDPQAPYLREILEREYGRLWIVHRLDRDTSGLLIVARTAEVHRELNRQFEQRLVEKIYHALVEGDPAWDEKSIRLPLRANVGHKHRTVVDQRRGKDAQTNIHVLERYEGWRLSEEDGALKGGHLITLVNAFPRTGRTHQIRAHLAACGHPILGDRLYHSSERLQVPGLNRLALHAWSIAFHHPVRLEMVRLESAYPQDLAIVLSRLQKRCA